MSFSIIRYSEDREQEWDKFIEQDSINGTFLQQRRFLNYHPEKRFIDCSLMIYYKGNLAAVCPACKNSEGGG